MRRRIHVCQSVRGALEMWGKRDWKLAGKHMGGISAEAAKSQFLDWLSEGKLLIPFGEPCEGFDYKTGCPGHEIKEGEE